MGIKEVGFGDLPQEMANTRVMLERVPDEHLSWKPHDKNYTLGAMAAHIANLLHWGIAILGTDELDLADPTPPREEPTSTAQVLEEFDRNAQALSQAMDAADDEKLMAPWTLKNGGAVLMSMPRAANLRSFVVSHMIHHRAHLGMYLRLLNVSVPPIYGPTADEDPFH